MVLTWYHLVLEAVFLPQKLIGTPHDIGLLEDIGKAPWPHQVVMVCALDKERTRRNERGDISHIEELPEVRHIVAGAVAIEMQERILHAVEVARDEGTLHALIQSRKIERLHAAAGEADASQMLGRKLRLCLYPVDEALKIGYQKAQQRET